MSQQTIESTDYDNPWKSFIELYFRDFLIFFFPAIEADIDWSKPVRFLDKELQKVVRDAEIPKRKMNYGAVQQILSFQRSSSWIIKKIGRR